jgi:hypothetical protein
LTLVKSAPKKSFVKKSLAQKTEFSGIFQLAKQFLAKTYFGYIF